ncbi:MAG: hypothetical protein JO076_00435 [Verrucomicrobia bacterium]|nr:hypothetical protein [Verrucomicrobiota bacterium]
MLSLDATIKDIEQEKDRFHAYAEVVIPGDEDGIDQVELDLDNLGGRLYAEPLLHPAAGLHRLTISGAGIAPFRIGDQILVRCFSTNEIPD